MPSPATQHRGAAGRPSVSKEMRGKLPRRRGGALLFHLISQLYEKTSLIVTPNLYFAEGVVLFWRRQEMTTALLDPVAHYCEPQKHH
jgi:IstB-like ATP binding protein